MRKAWTSALPRLDNCRQLYFGSQWIVCPKRFLGQHWPLAQGSSISVIQEQSSLRLFHTCKTKGYKEKTQQKTGKYLKDN